MWLIFFRFVRHELVPPWFVCFKFFFFSKRFSNTVIVFNCWDRHWMFLHVLIFIYLFLFVSLSVTVKYCWSSSRCLFHSKKTIKNLKKKVFFFDIFIRFFERLMKLVVYEKHLASGCVYNCNISTEKLNMYTPYLLLLLYLLTNFAIYIAFF